MIYKSYLMNEIQFHKDSLTLKTIWILFINPQFKIMFFIFILLMFRNVRHIARAILYKIHVYRIIDVVESNALLMSN